MVEYSKVKVTLSDTQPKKLKAAVKNKTGTTLRMSLKMLAGNNLPHVSTDLKLSIAQVFKKIQSGGFLRIIIK